MSASSLLKLAEAKMCWATGPRGSKRAPLLAWDYSGTSYNTRRTDLESDPRTSPGPHHPARKSEPLGDNLLRSPGTAWSTQDPSGICRAHPLLQL